MALTKYAAPIIAISGRIAGNIFKRDRAGNHVTRHQRRVRSESPAQMNIRNNFRTIVNAWLSPSMTDARRAAWTAFAAQHPITNKFGSQIRLTPFACFVRWNSPMMKLNLPILYDPPDV